MADHPNGDGNGWVRFGDRDTQVLHPATATAMLRRWHERNPALFGAYLAEAITGVKPTVTRERHSHDHATT